MICCPNCGCEINELPQQEDGPVVPLDLCFDVDGVIAKGGHPYEKCVPYEGIPEFIRKLKADGHRIKFQTARYMLICDGNAQKARDKGYYELKFWLEEHNIPYDEIHFGKVSSDLYVDDRGCRVESERGNTDWEKNFKSRLRQIMSNKRNKV